MLRAVFLLPALVLVIASCAGVDRRITVPEPETGKTYDVWTRQDSSYSSAVRQLISRADDFIVMGRLPDAETVLNRSLRIDNRTATVWSRLAWLSVEQHNVSRAQDYIKRSNSLTDVTELLHFNWSLYYRASEMKGDLAGIETANQALEALH